MLEAASHGNTLEQVAGTQPTIQTDPGLHSTVPGPDQGRNISTVPETTSERDGFEHIREEPPPVEDDHEAEDPWPEGPPDLEPEFLQA
jgi:hypothetical protein